MSPFLFLLVPALAAALLALLLFGSLRRCLRQRRLGGAALRALLLCSVLLCAIGLGALAAALFHYLALEGETRIAQIALRQVDTQRYSARLTLPDGLHHSYELRGDEWQLDVRIVRWKLPALLAGAPSLYRLERFSGRYGDVKQELEAQRTVHDLAADAFPDLWTLKRQFPRFLPFVDTDYGSAAYLPMLDGARYDVVLAPRGGVVARAADEATRRKLEAAGW